MFSPEITDKGRPEAASSPSPRLILACSIRGQVAAMVGACREFEKHHVYRVKERS